MDWRRGRDGDGGEGLEEFGGRDVGETVGETAGGEELGQVEGDTASG